MTSSTAAGETTQEGELQALCQQGQEALARTEYLAAERALADAERIARARGDWDTLARLYMPLQETRRQRRQLCGEGSVVLDLVAQGPTDHVDGRHVVENYPHGQLLVAGWGTIEPALAVRRLQAEHNLYVETFLAAVYPIAGGGRVVAVVPSEDVALPSAATERSVDELIPLLPPHSVVMAADQLPRGSRKGTAATYAEVMALWERLHLPFLAAADSTPDPIRRVEAYRQAIRVDYACELAHQRLSNTAHELARAARQQARG